MQQAPQMGFTSLNHHLDFTWLLVAYGSTRRDGATGVDGITAADYEADLMANLRSLLNGPSPALTGTAGAAGAYLGKGPGSKETRPIGIPTLEDKVLQRAIVIAAATDLRAGLQAVLVWVSARARSAHQALGRPPAASWMKNGEGWILEVDIRKFFRLNNIDNTPFNNPPTESEEVEVTDPAHPL